MASVIVTFLLACAFHFADTLRDEERIESSISLGGVQSENGPELKWTKDLSCEKVRGLFPESSLIKLDLDTSGLLKETSLEWAWMNKRMQLSIGGVDSLKLTLPMQLAKQKGVDDIQLTVGLPGFSVSGGILDLKTRLSMVGGGSIPDFSKLIFDADLQDDSKPALEIGLVLRKDEVLDENKLIISSVGPPNLKFNNLEFTGTGNLRSRVAAYFANKIGKSLSSVEFVQNIIVGWLLRIASDVVNDLLPADIIDVVLQDGHGFNLGLSVDATVSNGVISGDIRADNAKFEIGKESLLRAVGVATQYVLPLIPHKQGQDSDEIAVTSGITQAVDWGLSLASGAVFQGDIVVGPASEPENRKWGPELTIDSSLKLAGASDGMHSDFKVFVLGPLVRAGIEPIVAVLGPKGSDAVEVARQKWAPNCEYAELPNRRRMPVLLALVFASEQLHAIADMLNKLTLTTNIHAVNQENHDGWSVIISAVNHESQDEPVLHAHLTEQNLAALIGMLPPGVLVS